MNRKEFEEAVRKAKSLNPYAAAVLKAYVSTWDYKVEDAESWPSKLWVAEETHMHKDTVGDYVEALVKDGWLIPANLHGRAQGYWLAVGVVEQTQLKRAVRANNLTAKVECPDRQDIEMDENDDDQPGNVLMEPTQCPDGAAGNVLMEPTQCPDGQELISKNNQEEHPMNIKAASAGASAVTTDFEIKESGRDIALPPNFKGTLKPNGLIEYEGHLYLTVEEYELAVQRVEDFKTGGDW